ncbi:LysR family transcriptional regulator [Nocardia grenadensis]
MSAENTSAEQEDGRDSQLVDLRRLRQFVATVEAPSITAAAGGLYITQQALSSALRNLERELGVALFDRSQRSLRLTEAGRELYAAAPSLLAAATHIGRRAREAGAPRRRPFLIGHTPAISSGEVFELLRPLIVEQPDLAATAVAIYPDAIARELTEGRLDIVLRRGIETPRDLATSIVTYRPLHIAVATSHPLASAPVLEMRDLEPYPLIVWAPEHHSFYTDYLISHCRRAGFDPTVVVNRIQGTPPTTAPAVYPDGFAFVTSDPGPIHNGQVRVIPMSPPISAPTQALWTPHTIDPVRTRLLEMHSDAPIPARPPLPGNAHHPDRAVGPDNDVTADDHSRPLRQCQPDPGIS